MANPGPRCDVYKCQQPAITDILVPLGDGREGKIGEGCTPHAEAIFADPGAWAIWWDANNRTKNIHTAFIRRRTEIDALKAKEHLT